MTKKPTREESFCEKELVRGLRQGRENALKALMERHEKHLYTLIYSITLDCEESLEILQDVFIKAFQTIDQFRGDSSVSTWLRKIALNMSLNLKRKWKRRLRQHHRPFDRNADASLVETGRNTDTPETRLAEKQGENEIMAGIAGLPENLRTVLVLKTMENMSYDEISRELKIKKGTVSSRLHKARQLIRDQIGDKFES